MEWIEYQGKKILINDLANLAVEPFVEKMKQLEIFLLESHMEHVLILSDIRGAKFDKRNVAELKRISQAVEDQVEKYAVVGVTGLKKVLFQAVQMVARKKDKTYLQAFETLEEAKDWLVQ